MRLEDRLFDIRPKVVRADSIVAISVRPRFRSHGGPFQVTVTPMGGAGDMPSVTYEDILPIDGAVVLGVPFGPEQEYVIRIDETYGPAPVPVAEARVYAVEPDLARLVPWKGDLHMHSTRSDGREEPWYVAAACRRIGMDFMALTDHHLYEPSLEAIRAFDGCPTDLLMMPGEEVHPPDTGAHILNIGGSESVNMLLGGPEYEEGVAALEAAASDVHSEHRRAYAACTWCFEKIRALGGIAVFPHPYWVFQDAYNVPEPLLSALLVRRTFDALELMGGFFPHERESNSLQVARWQEERARGRDVPVVGNSDAHGCERGELFGWYYSIVFAEANERDSLAAAIRGMRSVAVEQSPGEPARVYGSFRMARYAHFLLREYFPMHDELAAEEGAFMMRWLEGDRSASAELDARKGRALALWQRLAQTRD